MLSPQQSPLGPCSPLTLNSKSLKNNKKILEILIIKKDPPPASFQEEEKEKEEGEEKEEGGLNKSPWTQNIRCKTVWESILYARIEDRCIYGI